MSTCRRYADDCILYHSIESKRDCICLQNDLNHFTQWNNLWQMKMNITKCVVIHYQGQSNWSGQSGKCLTTFQKLTMPQSKIINLCIINRLIKSIFYIAALAPL